jgi:hypothetical protein
MRINYTPKTSREVATLGFSVYGCCMDGNRHEWSAGGANLESQYRVIDEKTITSILRLRGGVQVERVSPRASPVRLT